MTVEQDKIKQDVLLWLHDNSNGEWCYPFKSFVNALGLNKHFVKAALHTLREEGNVEFRKGLFNEDGETAGSGYHITPRGQEMARFLQS